MTVRRPPESLGELAHEMAERFGGTVDEAVLRLSSLALDHGIPWPAGDVGWSVWVPAAITLTPAEVGTLRELYTRSYAPHVESRWIFHPRPLP